MININFKNTQNIPLCREYPMTDERRWASFSCDTVNSVTWYGVYALKCPIGGDTGSDKPSKNTNVLNI